MTHRKGDVRAMDPAEEDVKVGSLTKKLCDCTPTDLQTAILQANDRLRRCPADEGERVMGYTLRLLTGNGVSNGMVLLDGAEVGRTEPSSREGAIEQAREIVRSHAEGRRTVESVELG